MNKEKITISLTKEQIEFIENQINNSIFKYNKSNFIRELVQKEMQRQKKKKVK